MGACFENSRSPSWLKTVRGISYVEVIYYSPEYWYFMQDSVRLMLDRDGNGVHHEGGFRELVRTADAPCVPLRVLSRPDRGRGDRVYELSVHIGHDGILVPDFRRQRSADLRAECHEDGDGHEEGNENGDSENSFHFILSTAFFTLSFPVQKSDPEQASFRLRHTCGGSRRTVRQKITFDLERVS